MIVIKFTEFTDFRSISTKNRAKFSTCVSEIIQILSQCNRSDLKHKRWAVDLIYTVAYNLETGNHFNSGWKTLDDLKSIEIVDEFTCKDFFRFYYVPFDQIEWDIESVETSTCSNDTVKEIPKDIISSSKKSKGTLNPIKSSSSTDPTPKEHLYLAPPKYPRFDTSLIKFAQHAPYDRISLMYESLPKIPHTQNEISITTCVDEMTDSDLLKLYPNHIIQTRKPMMYEPVVGAKFFPDIGVVLPIEGFTQKQLIDNIIQYPHLYHITRKLDNGEIVPFHKFIEIDGKLSCIDDIWETLSISKVVPKKNEYVMDYVIRRYLLERDIKHIDHKYKIHGSLDPFLTLFAPPEFYLTHKYKDPTEIARKCVKARINYRSSRNGILENSGVDRCIFAPYCFNEHCKVVCPTFQQVDYLLDKNELLPPNSVFSMSKKQFNDADKVLQSAQGSFVTVETDKSSEFARLVTYCGICNTWNGSKFSMVTYNLKFSRFSDLIRQSWSMREEPDELQYMKIWSRSAKILIISHIDYVSLGDVECQQLLQLIQDREDMDKSTIVVVRKLGQLVSKSMFFRVLLDLLESRKQVIE